MKKIHVCDDFDNLPIDKKLQNLAEFVLKFLSEELRGQVTLFSVERKGNECTVNIKKNAGV